MLAKEIRKYIIDPVLAECGWADDSSRILIYGTGYVETAYAAIMQIGAPVNGGVGFYQCQPSDYDDISVWLKNNSFNRTLLANILNACDYSFLPHGVSAIIRNIAFATLICRVHYHRMPELLPPSTDAKGFAEYHKKFYNGGTLGKADVNKNTGIFERIINDEI